MICKYCESSHIHKDGNHKGFQRYKCLDCGKRFDGEKYEKKSGIIIHFNTRLKKSDRNLLTRENYCIPQKEISLDEKRKIQTAKTFMEINGMRPLSFPSYYSNIPNDIFEDEEHYTDEYLENHYKNCMKNFDLNMSFFESLNYDEFNKELSKFVKRNKFHEILDLTNLSNKKGAYILVLDKYKQVYIGVSTSANGIKGRILQHWSKKKEFDRLIFGSIETSILSIDSFGALDTTRIFYKEMKSYKDLYEYERKLVEEFKPEYRLNRIVGGLNADDDSELRNLKLMASIQKRKLN